MRNKRVNLREIIGYELVYTAQVRGGFRFYGGVSWTRLVRGLLLCRSPADCGVRARIGGWFGNAFDAYNSL